MKEIVTKKKPGSGKTKGATSFTSVTLKDLTRFVGEETPIPVSRVWLKKIGFIKE
jgi:hypothetical protein